ncbi:MAG: transpeptidase family protein [Bdellovibrionales bacterium]|nr:transpeptidase family protein [Bdellovibrionales bacterium]
MIRFRLFILASLLICGFGGVLFRAFQLQILPTENVARLARRQLSRRIEIVGRRGTIKDRDGRELAVSTNSVSLFVNPQLVKDASEVAHKLAPILGVSESSIRSRLQDAADKRFIWLGRQLKSRQMAMLDKIDLKNLAGVGILPEFRREYPQGSLAAHVLGFSSVDGNGIEGIEKHLDSRLLGDKNFVELRRDAKGRPIFGANDQIRLELAHGDDVELTLDSNLQFVAERALREAVETHEAVGGTAIVMDPKSGEVLVLANYPTFDPNSPGTSSLTARRNRAITDPIEPGSVVKPFVVARALEDHVVTPDSMISGGDGFIKVGNKTIGEADKKHRFKYISVTDLIRISSNVATVTLQQKMGWERVEDTYRKLGFGSLLGIDLGGESRGIFPMTTPKQLLQRATMSFGQGLALTPLQIATAYSTIANGGMRVRPHLIRNVESNEAEEESPAAKPDALPRVFSEATAQKMRVILEKVVENEGTGVAARIESFPVAGKTGTAQRIDFQQGGYEHGAYWSSFSGFVPSRAPRFVIYVMVDKPKKGGYYGGVVAAPVFAKIARAALQMIPAAAPETKKPLPALAGTTVVLPVVAKKLTPAKERESKENLNLAHVPDVTNLPLAQALRTLASYGFKMELMGEGDHVVEQLPPAGTKAEASRKIYLKLR